MSTPLRTTQCRVAVVEDSLLDRVAAVAAEVPDLQTVIVQETGVGHPGELPWRLEDSSVLTEAGVPLTAHPHRPEWKDPICVLFTSGTTGPSREW